MGSTRSVACNVLRGLAPVALGELRDVLGVDRAEAARDGTEIAFAVARPGLGRLLHLRCVVSASTVVRHAVPRPKALLGDEHFRVLLGQMAEAVALHPEGAFASFRIEAAGRDSPTMQRLQGAVAAATGLAHDPDAGDLVLRLRRWEGGWETLVRLSPRPLSARPWRVANLPGALNATIAAAMVRLASLSPGEHVVNLMAGSGTLAIEAGGGVAVEIDESVLAAARQNVDAAGAPVALVAGDATRAPLQDSSVDVVLADPPYGHRMGSHATNAALYASMLRESARLLRPGGRLAVITHELRRFEAVLREDGGTWRVAAEHQVFQKGHNPKIWLLERQ